MDKLAPAIAWTKENGFWLANGLLLLLMIGLWFMVTGSLNEEKGKNLSTIESETRTAQGILRKKPDDLENTDLTLHPNRTTQEGMQAELKRTVNSIVEAWTLRVEAQKELLVFPEVIGTEKFSQVFAPYNPPETFPVENADFRTIEPLLRLYKVKIQEHMKNICGNDGVRTNWRWDPANYEQDEDAAAKKRQGSSGGYDDYGDGGGTSFKVEDEDASRFAVLWSEVNQQLWYDKLTTFRERDDHKTESNDPTPLQCYMLQQDLWVLQAMFEVVGKLNGDSAATDTSAIKQVDHIFIGREGKPKEVELHPLDSRFEGEVVADDDAEDEFEDDGYSGSRGGGEDYGSAGGTGASQYEKKFSEDEVVLDPDGGDGDYGYGGGELGESGGAAKGLPPFHEMYVDTNFEPISSEQVLEVVNGETLSETNLELLIAKRLPVRIGLKMDERKIPDFMAACIDSPFSFEIQQVRINRHKSGGELVALGGGPAAGGGYDGYGAGDDASTKFDEVSSVETRVNYDVNVEFFGIIKIYNPVRADLIRKAAGLDPVDSGSGDNPDPADSAAIRNSSSGSRTAG